MRQSMAKFRNGACIKACFDMYTICILRAPLKTECFRKMRKLIFVRGISAIVKYYCLHNFTNLQKMDWRLAKSIVLCAKLYSSTYLSFQLDLFVYLENTAKCRHGHEIWQNLAKNRSHAPSRPQLSFLSFRLFKLLQSIAVQNKQNADFNPKTRKKYVFSWQEKMCSRSS